MTTTLIKSSKYQDRNYQCPPSMNVFLIHFYLCAGDENQKATQELQLMASHDAKNYPIF